MISRAIAGLTLLLLPLQMLVSPSPAQDAGVAHVAGGQAWADGTPVYMVVPEARRQYPNPTYWTYMPLPFSSCSACGDPCCQHGSKGIWTFPAVRWVLDPDYYTVAPDYGWSVPGKRPVVRQSVGYRKYTPDVWYGQQTSGKPQMAARYPVIAQPTDTTQMGYYAQHVPTWQPRNILPAPPHPRTWHVRECQPGPDGSYTRWVPIRDVWVPLHQIPQVQPEAAPLQPVQEQQALPPEPPVEKLEPVPAVPADKGPEAIEQSEDRARIRRVNF